MATVVVDTNVAVVASELAEQATPDCIVACIDEIIRIQSRGGLLIDSLGIILSEYTTTLSFVGRPGVGRAFVKWAFDNQANDALIRQIRITPRHDGGWRRYEEFPADEALRSFDDDDQVFAAVALASGEEPSVLNAVDSDWWNHRLTLEAKGVHVRFLCPNQFVRDRH